MDVDRIPTIISFDSIKEDAELTITQWAQILEVPEYWLKKKIDQYAITYSSELGLFCDSANKVRGTEIKELIALLISSAEEVQ